LIGWFVCWFVGFLLVGCLVVGLLVGLADPLPISVVGLLILGF